MTLVGFERSSERRQFMAQIARPLRSDRRENSSLKIWSWRHANFHFSDSQEVFTTTINCLLTGVPDRGTLFNTKKKTSDDGLSRSY
jgi:hypothetical protein